jgi:hypothetical protein
LQAAHPHTVKGDQMRRVKADADIKDNTWKRAKEWLVHGQLIEAGRGRIPEWSLKLGPHPLDGDAGHLRKLAREPSTAEKPPDFANVPPPEPPDAS